MEAPHRPPENPIRIVGNFTLPLPGIFTVPLTTLANLAYNFDRLIFHERCAATG